MRNGPFIAAVAASIVVSGASLGYAVGRHLSVLHYAPPAAAPERGPVESREALPREAVPPFEGWTNVFDPARGMASVAAPPPAATEAKPPSAFLLVGTVSSNEPSARRALLWGEGWKEPRAFREGQEFDPGVRVASVDRSGAWILRGKGRERLELLPVGSKARPPASAAAPAVPLTVPVPGAARPAPAAAAAGGPELRVEKLSPTAFALDEAGVNQLSGNFNQFMTQVRLVPFFEGNRPGGYRVAGIRPGTAFERLGFQSGDVIQSVNQIDLNSPEKLYTIFQNLKDERKVGVNVLRGGQKTTLTYEIR